MFAVVGTAGQLFLFTGLVPLSSYTDAKSASLPGLLLAVFVLAFASLSGRRWCLVLAALVSLLQMVAHRYHIESLQSMYSSSYYASLRYGAYSLWSGISALLQVLAFPLTAAAVPWGLRGGRVGGEIARRKVEFRLIAVVSAAACILLWVLSVLTVPLLASHSRGPGVEVAYQFVSPQAMWMLLIHVLIACVAATALSRWILRASAGEGALATMSGATVWCALAALTPATMFGTYGFLHQQLPLFLVAIEALAAATVFALVEFMTRRRAAAAKPAAS